MILDFPQSATQHADAIPSEYRHFYSAYMAKLRCMYSVTGEGSGRLKIETRRIEINGSYNACVGIDWRSW